jgi:hypothetical protein
VIASSKLTKTLEKKKDDENKGFEIAKPPILKVVTKGNFKIQIP